MLVIPHSNRHRKTTGKLPPPAAFIHAARSFKVYRHTDDAWGLRYPTDWQLTSMKKAILVQNFGENGEYAAFSIIHRHDKLSNEKAIAKERESLQGSADFQLASAVIDDLPAVKVIRSAPNNPDVQMEEYYVQDSKGRYYILMLARRAEWPRYEADFRTMLASMFVH